MGEAYLQGEADELVSAKLDGRVRAHIEGVAIEHFTRRAVGQIREQHDVAHIKLRFDGRHLHKPDCIRIISLRCIPGWQLPLPIKNANLPLLQYLTFIAICQVGKLITL